MILSLAKRNKSFLSPVPLNLIVAFLSFPDPSSKVTTPFPNRWCSTLVPKGKAIKSWEAAAIGWSFD